MMTLIWMLRNRAREVSMTRGARLALTAVAIVIFALLWNGLVHGLLLHEAEAALTGLLRPAGDRSSLLALLVTAGIAATFMVSHVWLVRPAGIGQGLVHGMWFGLLAGLLVDLNQYLLYPIPGYLASCWFLSGMFEFSCYGLIAAWLYPVPRFRRAGQRAEQCA
jgi:hypothetical protein